ncbi:MAG: hypothetical protein IJY08_05885 [Clostridia bacterium]|nr:hypothetical protein [Clostridia bacterium]
MKSSFIRIISCVTVFLMILSMVLSCAKEPDRGPVDLEGYGDGENTDRQGADTLTEAPVDTWGSTVETTDKYGSDFSQYDYSGAEIGLLTSKTYFPEIYAEDTSDRLSFAVFERKLKVEEMLNVTLALSALGNDGAVNDEVRRQVLSGEDVYQLVMDSRQNLHYAVGDSIYNNMLEIPTMELGKPYYSQSFIDTASIGEKLYTITGNASLSYVENAYATFFNMKIADAKGVPDLYDAAAAGKWTIEYQLKYCKDLFDDNGGNGQRDEGDTYGMITTAQWSVDPYISALGFDITKDNGGKLSVAVDTNKGLVVAELLNELFCGSDGTYVYEGAVSTLELAKYFVADTALFMTNVIGSYAQVDMKNAQYGILPMPKLDESQESYISYNNDAVSVFAIPRSVARLDMAGVVLDCLFSVSDGCREALFEDIMRYQQSSAALNMLELISVTVYVDTIFMYSKNVDYAGYFMRDIATKQGVNFITAWTMEKASVNKAVETINSTFEKIS